MPRGVALVIGCNTFPTWNSYPGLFASLATGNAVVVKPHPRAVLPLAITVADRPRGAGRGTASTPTSCSSPPRPTARAWPPSSPCAPRSAIIDYTGSSRASAAGSRSTPRAGAGLHREGRRQHDRRRLDRRPPRDARQPRLLARRSTAGRCARRRRTSTCPRDGIDDRRRATCRSTSSAPTSAPRSAGCSATTPRRSSCSAPPSTTTSCARLAASAEDAARSCSPSRGCTRRRIPTRWCGRRGRAASTPPTRTAYTQECFGPVAFLVTDGLDGPVARGLPRTVREHGAMTAAVYSTDERCSTTPGGRARRRGRPVGEPDRASSSTRRRRSPTSTAPAPTRPRTPR